MKRLLLMLTLMSLTSMAAMSQTGLNINKAFDGRYSNESYADEVTVTGSNLLGEDIQYYRALTVTDANATEFIRDLVVKDGMGASLKRSQCVAVSLRTDFISFLREPSHRVNAISFSMRTKVRVR